MYKETDHYAEQSAAQTLKSFEVDGELGLSRAEVQQRLAQYGPNEIEEKEEALWHRIFRRFWGPIPWMIEIAAILSAMVQKWEDFIIIMIMLLVNGALDFMQEHRALNALKALKNSMAREVTVLREGQYTSIPARNLVPGDLVKLRIGDIVPADVQLLAGDYLLIDQSALTGESLPVSRKINEVAYANTIIKQGEMTAVVLNTARRTRFASVVSLVSSATLHETSHFQKLVIRIGNFLILITVALVLLIIMVSLFRHENLIEILRFSLVLTVAAIPVALPAVLSVTMAVGAVNLARRKAIVSKLTAIEELAGVDVFCSDKTGTLTENIMQVAEPVLLKGHEQEELFRIAALASKLENNDPIELPIFHYIDEHLPKLDLADYRQVHFTPFDPVRKFTDAEIRHGEESFIACKGAAQVIIQLSELSDEQAQEIQQIVDQLASRGYRTLAVARKSGDAAAEMIGLIPLYDPPRKDSREIIQNMRDYGVRVKMVTGDHVAIAREVGRLMGLEGETIQSHQLTGSGSQELLALVSALSAAIYKRLKGDGVSQSEAQRFASDVMQTVSELYDTRLLEREFIHTHESAIIEMIEKVDLFAEVVPEDKYRIVDTLQKGGHIVAMTGDGVNDAAALKKADCGFAVSNATDAARAAADIILTAPGLSVINAAVKEARITFERMKSYATFRIAETLRIILFMTLAIVVFDFYPITALMIIILALLNDIPILAIAYDNTRINKQPVRWNMTELLSVSSVLGISGVLSSFLLFYILLKMGYPHEIIQSFFFAKLVIAGHGTIYNTRTDDWFWKKPYPSWILFSATFSTRVLGTLIAVYGFMIPAIGWTHAMYMWLYALTWFVINDAVKMLTYRFLRTRNLLM